MAMVCIPVIVNAKTHLSGNIGGMVFDKSGNPYIIDSDISIEQGKDVVLSAGVIFLFNSFTGLSIAGNLYVEGTEDDQVVFTSVQDAAYNPDAEKLPQAFDWNGIKIERNAGDVKMRNFRVTFSVYGIKSGKEDIVLMNGVFKDNGQFNFTVNDEIQMVEEKIYYTYGLKKDREDQQGFFEDSSNLPDVQPFSTLDSLYKIQLKNKKIAAWSCMGGAAACLGAAIICNAQSNDNYEKYHYYFNNGDPAKANICYDKSQNFRKATIGLGITSGVAGAASIALFIIKLKRPSTVPPPEKKEKKVSLLFNTDGSRTGLGLQYRF